MSDIPEQKPYMKLISYERFGGLVVSLIVLVGVSLLFQGAVFVDVPNVFAATASSTVVVGNAAPSVTNVTLNNASSIILTANTTTNVSINATISDNNGCGDVTSGTSTILLYRSGITSSTCMTTTSNLSCYLATAFTASSTCTNGSTNTTTTFAVYYFANATDSSSSYSTQNWIATVVFRDANFDTGSSDSSGQELLTLTALNVTTSSINYGSLSASSTSGAVNQVTTSTNAGNSSTSLQLSTFATLFGPAALASNTTQTYGTSTFTFQGTSAFLTLTATNVTGFFLTTPTTTTNVAQPVYWGITIPAGTPTGTYNGVNLFTATFQP